MIIKKHCIKRELLKSLIVSHACPFNSYFVFQVRTCILAATPYLLFIPEDKEGLELRSKLHVGENHLNPNFTLTHNIYLTLALEGP